MYTCIIYDYKKFFVDSSSWHGVASCGRQANFKEYSTIVDTDYINRERLIVGKTSAVQLR